MNDVRVDARRRTSSGNDSVQSPAVAAKSLSATFKMAVTLGIKLGVQLHLRSGADVDARDDKGRTPLFIAASKGHVAICVMLLEAGADLGLADNAGCDALHAAIKQERAEVVALLRQHQDRPDGVPSGMPEQPPAVSFEVVTAEAIDSDSDGDDDDEFDLSGWEPEVDPEPPPVDPAVLAAVVSAHRTITDHVPIDTDEDWSDVAIDLPEIIVRRRRRDGEEDARWLRDAGDLILVGLRDGAVPGRLVQAITPLSGTADKEDGPGNHDTLMRVVLGDLGIRVLDDDGTPWDPAPADDETEEKYASTRAEATAFLRVLLSPAADPLTPYCHALSRTKVLTRDEEGDIGRAMEEGRRQVLAIIARSPVAMDAILTTLDRVEREEIRWREIFADDGDGDGDEEDDEAVAEDIGSLSAGHLPAMLAERIARLREEYAVPIRAVSGSAIDRLAEIVLALGLETRFVEHLRALVAREEPDPSLRAALDAAADRLGQARFRLFHDNQKLVLWLARKHQGRGLPLMDLVQEGSIGLMKAVDRFDYKRGFKFSTYASWWIRQGVTRAIGDQARLIRVPIHMAEYLNKVRRARDAHEIQHGRLPTAATLAVLLDLDEPKVARALLLLEEPTLFHDLDEAGQSLVDTIPDPAPAPEEAACARSLVIAVRQAMEGLTQRERVIIGLRFGIGTDRDHTLEEVGQIYNVTRERIRQIEVKALKKLRHPLRSRSLRAFL